MASYLVNADGVHRIGLANELISDIGLPLTPSSEPIVVSERPNWVLINSDGTFKIIEPYIVSFVSTIQSSANTSASNILGVGATIHYGSIGCSSSVTHECIFDYLHYINVKANVLVSSSYVFKYGSESTYEELPVPSVANISTSQLNTYIQNTYYVGGVSLVSQVSHIISVLTPTITEITGLSVTSVSEVTSDSELINLVGALCYVTMTLIKLDGRPVGEGSYAIVKDEITGKLTYTETWRGVQITAKISLPRVNGVQIIAVDSVTTTTDSRGYAQIPVFQGLDVTISCPSLGSSVTFNTGNNNTLDISNYL